MMIDGVISFEPSHDTPPYAAENVAGETLALNPEPETLSKEKLPSSPVVAVCTCLPLEPSSATFAPGMPSSLFSTLPGVPPPGEKSRQTTPVIEPAFDAGSTACFALAGTASGGMPVSPRSATPPAASGFVSVKPRLVEPVITADDGCASWRTPDEVNQLRTAPIAAFTAPWFGSLMYITCQITPVANSEIAIGMNTAVLNATAQRMRSVNTAKTRPIAVTRAGATRIQMALFSIAFTSRCVVKIDL